MEIPIFPTTQKEAEKQGVQYSSANNKNCQFPSRLRELRESKGVSQAALAKEIGVSKSTVGLWETGDTLPDAKSICILAAFFDVNTDYILCQSDYRNIEMRGYNLEGMHFTEKAAGFLSHLSTAKTIASRQEHPSDALVLKSNSFEILMRLLESDKFETFLINAAAYLQLGAKGWQGRRVVTDEASGEKLDLPAEFAKDLLWTHCVSPLRECLNEIQFDELCISKSQQASTDKEANKHAKKE